MNTLDAFLIANLIWKLVQIKKLDIEIQNLKDIQSFENCLSYSIGTLPQPSRSNSNFLSECTILMLAFIWILVASPCVNVNKWQRIYVRLESSAH